MNVSLTPELEKLVTRKVESGLYQSASEVIREGLRLLDDHDRLRELHLSEVRNKIQTGLDQLDRGEGIPGDQAHTRIFKTNSGDNFARAVAAVVIDDQYLVADSDGIKRRASALQHAANILCFVECGNDERQRFLVA